MLDALLRPDTVAVIGASRTPEKVGHEVVANLIKGGFEGKIIPVNPSADEVLGLPCYPDLKSSGEKINLSVIAVPTQFVKQAVHDSVDAGAGAIAIITAGFKEVSEEGAAQEHELAEYCRAGHENVGSCFNGRTDIIRADTAVHFDANLQTAFVDHFLQVASLVQRGSNEGLTTETGIDTHKHYQVDIVKNPFQRFKGGGRIENDPGFHAQFFDPTNGAV